MTKRDSEGNLPFDWEVFNAMLQFKATKKYCAEYLGTSEDTIERRIRDKYDMTFKEYQKFVVTKMTMSLQQKAISISMRGNVPMMIFTLKNLAGWSDKKEETVTTQTIDDVIKKAKEDDENNQEDN